MSAPFVSIIATFYNQGLYIPRLIKSVLHQTFDDWELICVNDCSPGNDQEILEKWAAKTEAKGRITVIKNKTNLKASKSRHIGIERAKGMYLAFIDGDDWIEKDYLQVMVDEVKTNDLDMVIVNAKRAIPLFNISQPATYLPITGKLFTSPQIMDKYFLNFFGVHFFMPGYWAKLIRKEIIEKTSFKPINRDFCEDEQFLMSIWPHLTRLKFLDYCGYCWRWGTGVTSYKSKSDRLHYIIDNYFEYYRFKKSTLEEHNYEKARIHLLREFKNIIRDCIDTTYKFDDKRAKKELSYLSEILSKPEIKDLKHYAESCNSPITNAILNQDAKTVYSIIRETKKDNRIKKHIFVFFSRIVSLIP